MDKPNPSGERELIDFVSSITDSARLRIEENLPHGFVRLKVAEAERRQAQHDIRSVEDIITELVRNSRDAGARHVLVGFQKEQGRFRKITVLDDGCGIPEDMHQLVFEPRVTSKSEDFEEDRYGVHGRGMALFSICSRTDSASIVSSVPGLGTAIAMTVDTEKVPERSDQATLPQLETVDGVENVGTGPHNVPRILLEMSVDSPEVSFFLGSNAEVLATARYLDKVRGRHATGAIWSDLAPISEARNLVQVAEVRLGLPVSERNAYRIMGEEIKPLETVYRLASAMAAEAEAGEKAPPVGAGSRRTGGGRPNPLRRLGGADMEEIADAATAVVDKVVGRYFLKTAGQPKIRRGRGKLIISLYVTGQDGDEQ
jgi:Histidine kinase-, DNA gyrase B-, and HSP90-like ATPase